MIKPVKRDIRVLFLNHGDKLYGAQRSLLPLVADLRKKGVYVAVGVSHQGDLWKCLKAEGIITHHVKFPLWVWNKKVKLKFCRLMLILLQEILAELKLVFIIKKDGISTVYTNTMLVVAGAWAAKICGIKHIWHLREIYPPQGSHANVIPFGFLEKLMAESYQVIANSSYVREQFKRFNIYDRIKIIYNGIAMPNINEEEILRKHQG